MRHVCLVALLAATLRPPDTDGNLKSVLGEEKLGQWRQYQNDQAGRGSSEPIAPVASKPTESSEGHRAAMTIHASSPASAERGR